MTPDTIRTAPSLHSAVAQKRLQLVYPIMGAAILILGVWTSLMYSLGQWGPDADIAAQVVLRQGVLRHGLAFLTSWSYTPDNWLLSLTPITSLIYTIFGTKPIVVIGVGWLIFAASVAMTALLAYRIAGLRAALPVLAALLFANYDTLGSTGFLSYPVSHNITMAWALLSLVLAHRAMARQSLISAALAGFCVFVAALSDPWGGPGIALPLILVSLLLAAMNWRRKQGWLAAAVCGCIAVGFLAARTRLFGALDFLPVAPFAITDADGLGGNVGWLFRVVAIMFNILPLTAIDSVPANIFNFGAFATIFVGAVLLALNGLREATVDRQLVIGVCLLSIAGVSVAFLMYQFAAPSLIIGRFFPNLYYFGILLLGTTAATHWGRLRIPVKAAFLAYAALFIASGVASNAPVWTRQSDQPLVMSKETSDIRGFAGFLMRNGLTYGYGPYWGAEALAMDWMTKGRVTVRAVSFDPDTGRINGLHPETSKLFFSPDDEPAGTAETFLIVNDDGENCPSVDTCVDMAIRQFGEPSRRLTFEESIILVWPHPIVSKIIDY